MKKIKPCRAATIGPPRTKATQRVAPAEGRQSSHRELRTAFLVISLIIISSCTPRTAPDYVVLQSRAVADSPEWAAVTAALMQKHDAQLFTFAERPAEALEFLRSARPRYVAIVEMPEHLNRDYIIDGHALSRRVDEDIYADYLWGVISGPDAAAAMRMVTQTVEPLIVRSAVATIMETNSARWFDRYGYVDDHTPGLWGRKNGPDEPVVTDTIDPRNVLRKFTELYAWCDPDLVLTAAHATQRNLEMPFSLGNLRPCAPQDDAQNSTETTQNSTLTPGKLIADKCAPHGQKTKSGEISSPELSAQREGNRKLIADDYINRGRWSDPNRPGERWELPESGKRKVYFAVGNCLIGDFAGSASSMAPTWIGGHNTLIMSGYVVTTWHGRNGWGGLKYWLTTPGRYTLAEAIYLNQQDFLHQFSAAAPSLTAEPFDYEEYLNDAGNDIDPQSVTMQRLAAAISAKPQKNGVLPENPSTYDLLGFWHDRDVLAFYGDPKWDVRLQQIPAENDFTVRFEPDSRRIEKARRVRVTIETSATFEPARMAGGGFKQEHVLDLPFSYFFPSRLDSPRLAAGQVRPDGRPWQMAVAEDFMLIYNPDFRPSQRYTFVLEIGR